MKPLQCAALCMLLLTVLAAAQAPVINAGGVVNAADYTANLTGGMIISIFGSNLAPTTTSAKSTPLPTELEGVWVYVLGYMTLQKAPLFFVSPGQINAQLPFAVDTTGPQVRVHTARGDSNSVTIRMLSSAPRLLTKTQDGKGEAILVHADYRVVTADNPAAPGETLILYVTGLGPVTPSIEAGEAGGDGSAGRPLNLVRATVTVKVNGKPAAVSFVGLAPYFVGLYQVNFQVPPDTASGTPTITVWAGEQESQAQVLFACGSALPPPVASGSVGPEGGTVTAGQFSLSVPPGAFGTKSEIAVYRGAEKTDLDAYRISGVYELGGLPANIAAPLTVTIEVPGSPAVAGETYLVFEERGEDTGLVFLKASVEGNRATATLPVYQDASAPRLARHSSGGVLFAAAEDRRGAAGAAQWVVQTACYVIGRYKDKLSRDGHFKLHYATNVVPDVIGNALEDAYTALAREELGLGFNWAMFGPPPIEVYLVPAWLAGADLGEQWGTSRHSSRPAKSILRLNVDFMNDPLRIEEAKLKAGHLLFHLMQDLHAPVAPEFRGRFISKLRPWLWLDEATATWFERCVEGLPRGPGASSVPQQAWDNFDFLTRHGLEFPVESSSVDPLTTNIGWVRRHGYGAYFFVEHLMSGAIPYGYMAKWYQKKSLPVIGGTSSSPFVIPLEGLQAAGLNVSAKWLEFCNAFMEKDILSTQPSKEWHARVLALAKDNTASFNTGEAAKNLVWEGAPNLSARFYRVYFPGVFQSESDRDKKLTVSLGSTGVGVRAVIRKVSADGQIGAVLGELTMEPANPTLEITARNNFDGSGQSLLIMVVNTTLRPWDGTANVALSLKLPSADWVNTLNHIQLWWGPVLKCVPNTDPRACPPSEPNFDTWNNFSAVRWTGPREFTYSGPSRYSDGTVKLNGKLSQALDKLESLHWELSWTIPFRIFKAELTITGLEGGPVEQKFLTVTCGQDTTHCLLYNVRDSKLKDNFGSYVPLLRYTITNAAGEPLGLAVEVDWARTYQPFIQVELSK